MSSAILFSCVSSHDPRRIRLGNVAVESSGFTSSFVACWWGESAHNGLTALQKSMCSGVHLVAGRVLAGRRKRFELVEEFGVPRAADEADPAAGGSGH